MTEGRGIDFGNPEHYKIGLEAVGDVMAENLTQALAEVAETIGGPDLRDRVLSASEGTSGFPEPDGLRLLNELQPGTGKIVIGRMMEIGEEKRAQEASRNRLQRYGRRILDKWQN